MTQHDLNDAQLLRYSRHILLPEIDIAGQIKLLSSRILIIGVGGLGSPVAMYLAASGVGELTLCDHDHVEISNLQRQIVHDIDSLGMNKAHSAARRLQRMNPETHVRTLELRADRTLLEQEISLADLVLDCSDNFSTRYLINELCVAKKTPLISGAAIGFQGQLGIFDFRHAHTACYACIFPDHPDAAEHDISCALFGVFAPLVGVIGSSQALAALTLLLGIHQETTQTLRIYHGLKNHWQTLSLHKDPQCPVCAS